MNNQEINLQAVDFYNKYVLVSKGSKDLNQVSQLLNVKEPVFNKFLIDNKILYTHDGSLLAMSRHIKAGRFETKTGVEDGCMYIKTYFTGKGITWIAGEYAKFKVGGSK
jgi:phage antirepressor YoqD-like protein